MIFSFDLASRTKGALCCLNVKIFSAILVRAVSLLQGFKSSLESSVLPTSPPTGPPPFDSAWAKPPPQSKTPARAIPKLEHLKVIVFLPF
ncbi:MAG: hypothetical protein ABIR96_11305, partial [Bdellovibrionota bacterium]